MNGSALTTSGHDMTIDIQPEGEQPVAQRVIQIQPEGIGASGAPPAYGGAPPPVAAVGAYYPGQMCASPSLSAAPAQHQPNLFGAPGGIQVPGGQQQQFGQPQQFGAAPFQQQQQPPLSPYQQQSQMQPPPFQQPPAYQVSPLLSQPEPFIQQPGYDQGSLQQPLLQQQQPGFAPGPFAAQYQQQQQPPLSPYQQEQQNFFPQSPPMQPPQPYGAPQQQPQMQPQPFQQQQQPQNFFPQRQQQSSMQPQLKEGGGNGGSGGVRAPLLATKAQCVVLDGMRVELAQQSAVPVSVQVSTPLEKFTADPSVADSSSALIPSGLQSKAAAMYFQVRIVKLTNNTNPDASFAPLMVGVSTSPLVSSSMPPGFTAPPAAGLLNIGLSSLGPMLLNGRGPLSGVQGMQDQPFFTPNVSGWQTGDIIGCKIDLDLAVIYWHVNGVPLGVVTLPKSPVYSYAGYKFYPTISLLNPGDSVEFELFSVSGGAGPEGAAAGYGAFINQGTNETMSDSSSSSPKNVASAAASAGAKALFQGWRLDSEKVLAARSSARLAQLQPDLGIVLDAPLQAQDPDILGINNNINNSNKHSVVISKVLPGSAAEMAGLRVDDQVVSINHTPIRTLHDAMNIVSNSHPATILSFELIRRSKMTLPLTLGAKTMPVAELLSHARWVHHAAGNTEWVAPVSLILAREAKANGAGYSGSGPPQAQSQQPPMLYTGGGNYVQNDVGSSSVVIINNGGGGGGGGRHGGGGSGPHHHGGGGGGYNNRGGGGGGGGGGGRGKGSDSPIHDFFCTGPPCALCWKIPFCILATPFFLVYQLCILIGRCCEWLDRALNRCFAAICRCLDKYIITPCAQCCNWICRQLSACCEWLYQTFVEPCINCIAAVCDAYFRCVAAVCEALGRFFVWLCTPVFRAISAIFSFIWRGICIVFGAIWRCLCTVFGAIWRCICAVASAFWKCFYAVVVKPVMWIGKQIYACLSAIFRAVWDVLCAVASFIYINILTPLGHCISAVCEAFASCMGAVCEKVGECLGAIADAIGSVLTAIYEAVFVPIGRALSDVCT